MENISNKQKVLSFYKEVIGQRKTELIAKYIKEDYIQHSPMVASGRTGVLRSIEFLKTLPQPSVGKSPILRAIQDGDLVGLHLDLSFMGKRLVVMEVFRLENGLLAEHWDVVQEQADENGQVITSTNGTTNVDLDISGDESKQLVNRLYAQIADKQPDFSNKLISDDIIEHDPLVIASGKRFDHYLSCKTDLTIIIHRIIAEGDFVMVQAEFKYPDKTVARYEIFRIMSGQAIEHWCAEQEVPVKLAHNNGMF